MAEEWSPSNLISKALASDMDPGVFSILNEEDIPKAKNFAEFCLGKKFLNVVPYPRQLQIGLGLFEEHCPKCTNSNWVHGEEKTLDLFDQPISEILDNVQFLEFGKCPRCGSNRNDFVKQGYFHNPTELAACCGQRCVAPDTLLLTSDGLVEIGEYAGSKPLGFSDFSLKLSTGTSIGETTKFFVSSPEKTYTVKFSNGLEITGTGDHPILTENGYVILKNIKTGMSIPVYCNQQIFGTSVINFSSLHNKINIEFEKWFKSNKQYGRGCIKDHKLPSGPLTLDDARFLGYMVSKGNTYYGIRVSNTEKIILDFCESILIRWFGDFQRTPRGIGLRTKKADLLSKELFGKYKKSADKEIPSCIRKAPKEYICSFLSGLYDGDGHVNKRAIEYSSISKKLAQQLSLILQNLGIPNKIYSKWAYASNGTAEQKPVRSYTVLVEGPALEIFHKNISLNLDRKQKALEKAISYIHARKLDMPFWYQKYSSADKVKFIELLKDIKKHLNKQKHPFKKKAGMLGLLSVLGAKNNDIYRRMKRAKNVSLSKKKVITLLTPFRNAPWKEFLSEDLHKRIDTFIKSAEEDSYHILVKTKEDGPITTTYDFTVDYYHSFWSNGIVSSNSGKSAVTAMIAAYVLHRYLSVPDPINYLNLLSSSQLYISMTAISAAQAEASLWAPFREYVDEAPWFKEYHQMLQDTGERLGTELLHRPRTFLVYKHKRIVCMYEAPNKRRLRGKTRIFCVSGDTQVTTNLGTHYIKDLFKAAPSIGDRVDMVSGLKVLSENGFEEATHLFQYKQKPGIRLVGEDGTELTGTTCHPVKVYNVENGIHMRELKDIVPGRDYFVIKLPEGNVFPMETPKFNFSYVREYNTSSRSPKQKAIMDKRTHSVFPEELTDDLAELMGFLWAEGSLAKYKRKDKSPIYKLKFVSSDDYCIERYKKLFVSCFGKEPTVEKQGNSTSLISQSAAICQFMNYLGYEYGGCTIKDIPWPIRKAPREKVILFLRNFFDGDGMADSAEINTDLSAPKLAEGIRYFLFQLGILSKITHYTRDGGNYHKVSMCGKWRDKFFDTVGFGLERKQIYSNDRKDRIASKWEILPINVESLRYKAKKAKKISCMYKVLRPNRVEKNCNGEYYNRVSIHTISSDLLKNIKSMDEKTANVLEEVSNLFFSKITSKKDVGYIDVYDFTIQPSHSFTANCVINGNSSIDELGWLEADATKQSITLSADEISAALDNSLRTVRSAAQIKRKQGLYNSIDAYACNISSPSEKDDKMMRNVRAARTNRTIYACHYPTWEANPTITRESLQPEFEKSKMVAERDFGAIPPLANDPFIDNPHCIDLMIDPKHQHNLMSIKINYHTDDFGNKTKYASVHIPHIDKRKPRMLLVDAGEKRNHFAVMLMTWDTKRNRPRVDYVFDVTPEEGIPINFALMWEHCFKPMIHGLLIKHMFSDTWNSTDLVQNLRQGKVMSEQYSLKFQDFVEIAARLSAGELILPKPELPVDDLRLTYENPVEFVEGKPILTLILQMLTVRQVGRRITKPINGDDDMFRALCLGMYHIVQPQFKKIYAVDAAGGAGGNIGVILSKNAGSSGIDRRKTTSGARLVTKRGYKNR